MTVKMMMNKYLFDVPYLYEIIVQIMGCVGVYAGTKE